MFLYGKLLLLSGKGEKRQQKDSGQTKRDTMTILIMTLLIMTLLIETLLIMTILKKLNIGDVCITYNINKGNITFIFSIYCYK